MTQRSLLIGSSDSPPILSSISRAFVMNNIEHLDAIVIGAGISGISAAYHLQKHCPTKRYKVLEKRANLGGTWDLFNYPGIRSDSDMYTFGFSFRHWEDDSSIAEKGKILNYLGETAKQFGIDKRIDYEVEVRKASWDSNENRWTLTTRTGDQYCCQYLFMCSGYYNYEQAHTPEFDGIERFNGDVIHPQFWPKDFDYSGKKVVVIGSGATAITLVPAMADTAEHVTMLQRSPTYMGAKPAVDPIANRLGSLLGRWAARWWFILSTMFIFAFCKLFPSKAKRVMKQEIKDLLGDKFDDKHFTPTYDPWDQRVCLCPDGDFFDALNDEKASIETDTIDGFEVDGIRLNSGKKLDADVIVTATGLKIQFFGGMDIVIDEQPLRPNDAYVYKGMMLSDVPNTFLAVGYTNASWTLKVDLTHRYATRLINYMDKNGYQQGKPKVKKEMHDIPLLNLSSGYIQRSIEELPKQASRKPWRLNQNYILDTIALKYSPVTDQEMEFL